MGHFRSDLFYKLAAAACTAPEPDGADGAYPRGCPFTNGQLKELQKYKDLLFRLVMLRAYNFMQQTAQDRRPEKYRTSCADISFVFSTITVHADQLAEQMKDSDGDRLYAFGGIPPPHRVALSAFEDKESLLCLQALMAQALACD